MPAEKLINTKAKYYKVSDALTLGVGENADQISHLAFKMAAHEGITIFNMADGVMDQFEDNTGIDAGNSTDEQYDATNDHWSGIAAVAGATTGFTSTGAATWTAPTPSPTDVEILIVAGGGGGGTGWYAGGAGAGGVVHDADYAVVAGTVYDLTVGVGGTTDSNSSTKGGDGADSVFNINAEGSGIAMTAVGGGGGGSRDNDDGSPGGSGGGGGDNGGASGPATQTSPSGATGYGFAGALSNNDSGGGGGGSAAVGDGPSSNPVGGSGGAGRVFSNFVAWGTDSSNAKPTSDGSGSGKGYFAGGGAGASNGNYTASVGEGGVGGGAEGKANGSGNTGQAATGGGGGGGAGSNSSGGVGGTGFVGIYYAAFNLANNVTLVSTATTALSAPTNARIILHEQATGTITIGTDIKAYASRDNGTTYTEFTNLALEANYESGKRIISGSVDVSGQPSGTTMRYKVRGFNNTASKYFVLHGVSLTWS